MCGTARSTFLALICGLLVSGGAFVTLMAVDQSLLGANNEPGAQARGGAADDLVVARIGLLADQRHVLTRPPVTRRPRTKARREHPPAPTRSFAVSPSPAAGAQPTLSPVPRTIPPAPGENDVRSPGRGVADRPDSARRDHRGGRRHRRADRRGVRRRSSKPSCADSAMRSVTPWSACSRAPARSPARPRASTGGRTRGRSYSGRRAPRCATPLRRRRLGRGPVAVDAGCAYAASSSRVSASSSAGPAVELSRCAAQQIERVGVALVDDLADLGVDQLLGRRRRLPSSPSGDSWPGGGSTVTGPIASDMPQRPDHLPGDVAHLVEVALGAGRHVAEDDLLGRPAAERADDPAAQVFRARSRSGRLDGLWKVTPSACPRGMMVILRTGSAPGVSMPSSAWPRLVEGGALLLLGVET